MLNGATLSTANGSANGSGRAELLYHFQRFFGVLLHALSILDDVSDHALFVYDERDTANADGFLIEDSESPGGLELGKVGHQWIIKSALLGEGALRRRGVCACTQNLGVQPLEVREQALELPQLALSPAGKRPGVEGDDYVLLSFEIRQPDFLTVSGSESDVRDLITYVHIAPREIASERSAYMPSFSLYSGSQ